MAFACFRQVHCLLCNEDRRVSWPTLGTRAWNGAEPQIAVGMFHAACHMYLHSTEIKTRSSRSKKWIIRNEVKSIQINSNRFKWHKMTWNSKDCQKLQVSSPRLAKVLGLRCPWNKLRCMGSRRSPEVHKVQKLTNSSANTPNVYQRGSGHEVDKEKINESFSKTWCTEITDSEASGCLGSSSVRLREPDQTRQD